MDFALCPTFCQGITIVKELFLFAAGLTVRQLLPRKRFRSTVKYTDAMISEIYRRRIFRIS
jgi:hypothetical protein